MNRSNSLESKRKAFSAVAVLLGLVILLSLGAGMLSLGLNSRTMAIRTSDEIEARCAADAGLANVLFQMNRLLEARSWDPIALRYKFAQAGLPYATDESLPNCEATIAYKVAPSSTKAYSEFFVTSVGQCGRSVKTVSAIIKVKSIFDNAILVQDRISLMPNSLVTGYNSADPLDTDIDVKIGTTSTLADRIPLGPGTVVDGDIFVGVDGDPKTVIGAGGTVNGAKFALLEPIEFPVIAPPPLPDIGTSLSAKESTLTIGPADSGTYTDITLLNGPVSGVLEITGGDVVLHITGNIDMGKGCEIVVRSGSSLTVYVDGDVYADNSIGFNNEAGNVKDFALYATGTGEQIFNLKAKSSIFGTVYAPNVDITMYPGSSLYGAIVGKSVTFKSGGAFYYDEALQDATIYDTAVRFVIKRWREE